MTTHVDVPTRSSLGRPTSPAELPASPAFSAAAKRRVSRKSLTLSVLVVVLGGLLAFTAGQMLTAHSEVLAVARDVAVGSTITAEDLVVADVSSDPNLSPISADQQPQVIGMVAQVDLSRGALLTPDQIGPDAGLPADQVLVALPLHEGQFPARGLSPGQQVLIVPTPGNTGSAVVDEDVSSESASVEATVADVGSLNVTTQITVVDVQLSATAGAAAARLASTGNLAIVVLPAGG